MGEFSNISKEAVKGIFRKYSGRASELIYVKRTLLNGGCPKTRIEEAERELRQGVVSPILKIKVAPKEFPERREILKIPEIMSRGLVSKLFGNRLFWYIFGGLLLVVVMMLIIVQYSGGGIKNCGSDEFCFLDATNECGNAKFRNEIAGAKIEYVVNNCILEKKVAKLASGESKEDRNRFEGKSMSCNYEQGDFDRSYIDEISANLEQCDGELRTEIENVI